MSMREILPSAHFALIWGSIAISAGLIYAANVVTAPQQVKESADAVVSTSQQPATQDWQANLREIQGENGSSSAPSAPNQDVVQNLLNAAQSDNVTDTVARTLLVNLSTAKAQGLGNDIPTQDNIIADAASKATQQRGAPAHTLNELTTVDDSPDAMHAYGNAVMAALLHHPKANENDTLFAIGYATDNRDQSKLAAFPAIGADYKGIADELLTVPVPKTLAPFHLAIINDFVRVSQTFPDMQTVLDDPLRGLSGLQMYQSLVDELARMFTTTAVSFSKDGILFTKDEPGSAWSLLVGQQSQS